MSCLILSLRLGLRTPKPQGSEVDDFLAAAVAAEERSGGTAVVASGDRDAFPARLVARYDPLPAAGWRTRAHRSRRGLARYGVDPNPVPDLLRSAVTLLTNCLALPESDRNAPLNCLRRYGTLDCVLKARRIQTQAEMLRLYLFIATMNAKAPCLRLPITSPHGAQHPISRAIGG